MILFLGLIFTCFLSGCGFTATVKHKDQELIQENKLDYEVINQKDFLSIESNIYNWKGSDVLFVKNSIEYLEVLKNYPIYSYNNTNLDIFSFENIDRFFMENNLIIAYVILGKNEQSLNLNNIHLVNNNLFIDFNYKNGDNDRLLYECVYIKVDKNICPKNLFINMINSDTQQEGSEFYSQIKSNFIVNLKIKGIDDFKLDFELGINDSYILDESNYLVDNYKFEGLYYDTNYTHKYENYPIKNDTVLYAKFIKEKIKIEFIIKNLKTEILLPVGESIFLNDIPVYSNIEYEGLYYDKDFSVKYNGEKINEDIRFYVKVIETLDNHLCKGSIDYEVYDNRISFTNLKKDIIIISTYNEFIDYLKKEGFAEVVSSYLYSKNIFNTYTEGFFENNSLIIGKQINSDTKLHICGLEIISNKLIVNIKSENEINEKISYSTNCFIFSIKKELIQNISDIIIHYM